MKLLSAHTSSKIHRRFYDMTEAQRLHAVGQLLAHYRPVSTRAFCNTKQQCRDQVLVRFANCSTSVLVATDIAARGLDITQLEAVINIDITPDADTHTHRIGRTGRADEDGWAFSLASLDEMGTWSTARTAAANSRSSRRSWKRR